MTLSSSCNSASRLRPSPRLSIWSTTSLSPFPTYQLGVNIFPAPPTSPLNSGYAASLPNGTSAFVLDSAGRTPYVQQWNLSIQHSFTLSDVLELAYLGSSDHNLQNRYDIAACAEALLRTCGAIRRLSPIRATPVFSSPTLTVPPRMNPWSPSSAAARRAV